MPEVGAEAGHLSGGVNAGIGPTCSSDVDVRPDDSCHGILKHPLNSARSRLYLPAVIVGPVILDRQLKGWHKRPERQTEAHSVRSCCKAPSPSPSPAGERGSYSANQRLRT